MSRVIECRVNDEYILGSGVPIGAAGSFGDVQLRLIFNEMWDGLSIVATFKDALGQSEQVVMLLPSMIVEGAERTYLVTVPKAAKAIAGRCKLTLSGYSTYTIEANGTKSVKKDSLTNTATAFFHVLEADSAIVVDESVDATYLEQVQGELNLFGEQINGFDDEMDEWNRKIKAVEEEEEKRINAEKERRIIFATSEAERQGAFATSEAERQATFEAAEVARNQIVGDLNKALDEIIALQKSYIGGGA